MLGKGIEVLASKYSIKESFFNSSKFLPKILKLNASKTLLKTFDADYNKHVEAGEFEFYLQKTKKTKNKTILKRQWRKFGTADFDGNRKLSITEFTAFLFPQFYEGTKKGLK